MTTYTVNIQQSGATQLYTPINKQDDKLTRSGVGLPFNVTMIEENIIMEEDFNWLVEEDDTLIYEEKYYG